MWPCASARVRAVLHGAHQKAAVKRVSSHNSQQCCPFRRSSVGFGSLFLLSWRRNKLLRRALGEACVEKAPTQGSPQNTAQAPSPDPTYQQSEPGGSLFHQSPFWCLGYVFMLETEVQRGCGPCPRSLSQYTVKPRFELSLVLESDPLTLVCTPQELTVPSRVARRRPRRPKQSSCGPQKSGQGD